MKLKTFILFGALSTIFTFSHVSAAYAESSWWEFFFPSLRNQGPNPAETLKAPFADQDAILEGASIEDRMAGNSSPLHVRHRLNEDIAKWVESEMSDLISYDSKSYKEDYEKKARSFDKKGLKEYVGFLQEHKIVSSLKSGAYNVRSIVKDVPILLNQGPIADRYRWLYRAKVLVSLVPIGMEGYSKGGGTKVINKEITIDVHLGRVESANNEHGVLIEGWTAKSEEE
ncbi:MAG: DotI/IcmL family type IV secretion protein [Alphaproteobacteria bacterium]|nr:DotI/IcmL family type IV secretion protein [Alphaproteobacteria bacterium]